MGIAAGQGECDTGAPDGPLAHRLGRALDFEGCLQKGFGQGQVVLFNAGGGEKTRGCASPMQGAGLLGQGQRLLKVLAGLRQGEQIEVQGAKAEAGSLIH